MCPNTDYIKDTTKLTQPDEAYTPRELLARLVRNQRLPSLRCNYDAENSFDVDEADDDKTPSLDFMSDEPEPPRDFTDLDIASRIVKDFDKEIEKAGNTRNKKDEVKPVENAPE